MSKANIDTPSPSISLAIVMEEKGETRNTTVDSSDTIANDTVEKEEPAGDSRNVLKKPFKFKLTVFMLCMTSVIVAMDSVIVAATLPAITIALKGESLEAFWVGTSYLLSQTVCF
jgi:hypothetical protein